MPESNPRMWAIQHPDPANAKVGDEVTVRPVTLGPTHDAEIDAPGCDESPHGAEDCGHPENHWPTPRGLASRPITSDVEAERNKLRSDIGALEVIAERAARKGYDLDPQDVLDILSTTTE